MREMSCTVVASFMITFSMDASRDGESKASSHRSNSSRELCRSADERGHVACNHRRREAVMRVGDCMSRHIESVEASESVRAAAERMRACEVGALPVLDAGRVVGMVTDRDLFVRALARGLHMEAPVRLAMTAGVVTCFADEDVRAAA